MFEGTINHDFVSTKTKMTPTEQLYSRLDSAVAFFNTRLFRSELPNLLITVQRNQKGIAYFDPNRWGSSEGKSAHELAINSSSITSLSLLQLFTILCQQMSICWQHVHGNPSRRGYLNRELAEKMISIGLQPSSTGKPGGKTTGQNLACYPIEDGEFLKAAVELIETDNWQMAWVDLEYKETGDVQLPWLEEILTSQSNSLKSESTNSKDFQDPTSKALRILATTRTRDLVPQESLRPVKSRIHKRRSLEPKTGKTGYACACGTKVWGKPGLKLRCEECFGLFQETPPKL